MAIGEPRAKHDRDGAAVESPTIADGDLGGALHVDATIVGGEGVRGQPFDSTTRLNAANARAPAVFLE